MSTINNYVNRIDSKKTSPVMVQFAKNIILRKLKKLTHGHLTVIDQGKNLSFGEPASNTSVRATIDINDQRIFSRVFFGGTTGVAESYIAGEWNTPNVTDVIRLFLLNARALGNMESGLSRLGSRLLSTIEQLTPYTLSSAKKNILAHYDLSNDFFSLFLDPSMMYSSAIYSHTQQSLADASANKLKTICQKLELKPSDHLLEIGTGWGGMAIYAAQHYGCKVTTTTISDQQFNYAKEKVAALGLQDQITVLCKDYRLLTGQYDKLVSIEMIEAIGHKEFINYFSTCQRLTKEDGLLLIQAISRPDQQYHERKNNMDFIKRYIFPGGCLPCQADMLNTTAKHTDLHLLDIHDITLDYAKTLNHWKSAFFNEIDKVKALGFNQQFIRLWDFYLSYCEGGFAERAIHTSQLLFARPQYRKAHYQS